MKNIRKYLKKISLKSAILIILGVGLLAVGGFMIWVSTLQLPDFKSFTERKIQSSSQIYDRTGTILLYDINQGIKRTVIPYEDMGTNILNSTVAIEDSEFYQHKGIRLKSIVRAVWSNLTGGKVQGGSTITQQLIKNTLLTPQKSLSRKIKEWILSIKLEKVMSKDDILALYLNEAPYGGNIYGIEEASKAFFGIEPKELTLAESAYLAAIPNGPTYYSPYGKNKDKLDERKNLVLSRMFTLKFITTQDDYDKAKAEVVTFQPQQPVHIAAPHFVFYIINYLESRYGVDALEGGGLKIITTLDYNLQKKAEGIALLKAKENEKNWGGSNTAIVVTDPKTGQILSMVGSRDYFDKTIDGNFNVTTAARQPGSSFKPIVYALAFEKGYTEDTTIFDVRTEFNSSCSPTGLDTRKNCYSPDDSSPTFRGPLTLRNALAQSINIVAVKLLYLVGVSDSIKMAHNLGITTLKNDPNIYGLSLVIGGGETTLLDMTSVYGVFANNGIKNSTTGILSVEDGSGNVLEKYESSPQQIIKPNTTHILSSILSDDIARTPTFGANSVLHIPGREVAAKTGTTNDNKDAWTIGYTPSVAVGVWVGNNDNKPMKKGGVALAGPIWNAVMTEALKTLPVETFTKPDGIDTSLPPIIRGFWQGGDTFITDIVSGELATEYTPVEQQKETSITNVHTILYWLNKDNPLLKTSVQENDSQFTNWEYGVENWWVANKYKYNIVTGADVPTIYDNLHTAQSKPSFQIFGVENKTYNKNNLITLSFGVTSQNSIKKLDVFINNTYLTSLKASPFSVSFSPKDISDISASNTIHIVGVDVLGNTGEQTVTFNVAGL